MKELNQLLRANILSLSPYSTARDEFQGTIGTFLDANESPFDNGSNRYPDPRQRNLKSVLSRIKGVSSDRIFVGNGSDEAIDLCFRLFCNPGLDNAVAMAPSYGMYEVAAAINDIEVREVWLDAEFRLDTEQLLAACDERTKLLFLCSPNNPSGNSLPAQQIQQITKRFDGIVVLDEAYIDFSSAESALARLDTMPNLIVLQTLSKAWGMAGLRLGLAFAQPAIIEYMSRVKYPYNVNMASQQIAIERLQEGTEGNVKLICIERERVRAALTAFRAVERVYPSDANFLLVRFRNDADAVYTRLIDRGVIVRNRSRVRGCERCLRITIGTCRENDNMLGIISQIDG